MRPRRLPIRIVVQMDAFITAPVPLLRQGLLHEQGNLSCFGLVCAASSLSFGLGASRPDSGSLLAAGASLVTRVPVLDDSGEGRTFAWQR